MRPRSAYAFEGLFLLSEATAVAEAPVAEVQLSPEAEAERGARTEDAPDKGAVTGAADDVQTGDEADDGDEDGEEDPTEVAIKDARKADLTRLAQEEGFEGEFETVEQLQEARTERGRVQKAQEFQQTARNAYHATRVSIESLLDKVQLRDEDGDPVAWTPELKQPFLNSLNYFNNYMGGLYEQAYNEIQVERAQIVLGSKDKQADFTKRLNGRSDIDSVLKALVEVAGPPKTLEDALKDPKIKAEYAEALKAEHKKGQKVGKGGNRSGEPEANGGAGSSNVTYAQILKMSPAQVAALPEGTVAKAVQQATGG